MYCLYGLTLEGRFYFLLLAVVYSIESGQTTRGLGKRPKGWKRLTDPLTVLPIIIALLYFNPFP